MSTSRGLTAAAVMTLVALGTASPAEAVGPPPDGMYSFSEPGVPAATWKIYALCDAPFRQRAIPDFTDPPRRDEPVRVERQQYRTPGDQPSGKAGNFRWPVTPIARSPRNSVSGRAQQSNPEA